jgi:mRNA-degrading endonuclease toxin of MazEF toxin-antitoxin module
VSSYWLPAYAVSLPPVLADALCGLKRLATSCWTLQAAEHTASACSARVHVELISTGPHSTPLRLHVLRHSTRARTMLACKDSVLRGALSRAGRAPHRRTTRATMSRSGHVLSSAAKYLTALPGCDAETRSPPRWQRLRPTRTTGARCSRSLTLWRAVLVAPTSLSARPASFRPEIDLLGETIRVLVEQVGAIDAGQLGDLVGRVTPDQQWGIDEALTTVLGLR